jgi:hypothetical protein
MSSKLEIKDLDFIGELEPDLANLIYDVCELNIKDMLSALRNEDNNYDDYVKVLSQDKLEEMIHFYESMLEAFKNVERYEKCVDLIYILGSLKKYHKKVGSNQ